MTTIDLTLTPHFSTNTPPFQWLHIHITDPTGLIEADALKELTLPEGINWRQGVVIEGKAPIWLYGYLVHECHPAAWVACYDPRLGAVVAATHSSKVAVGTVFDVQSPCERA
ncbi:MAG: CRISPR-associated protein Csx3 [Cyanothece sp. SIO2G6]|nr:CRISPR-associated protein Csx3 [Cyanothece sp. SIO2G6]